MSQPHSLVRFTPPAPSIAKARAQEFPRTLTSAELRGPDERLEWVSVAYHTLFDTVLTSHRWHSASEVELPLPTRTCSCILVQRNP